MVVCVCVDMYLLFSEHLSVLLFVKMLFVEHDRVCYFW